MQELNKNALGMAVGTVSGVTMLILGLFGGMGFYTGAMTMMGQMHMFFSPSFFGIIGGIIEAWIIGYLFGYFTAWVYNKQA